MPSPALPPTLGARLQAARTHAFVGRRAEQQRFERALAGNEPALFWVHAPGGSGKSSLLRMLEQLAQARGLACCAIDFATLEASPAAVTAMLADGEGRPKWGEGRPVLFFDSYEHGLALDAWLRETLLPSLPETSVLVIASRTAPPAEWRIDPALQSMLHALALPPLEPDESGALLRARGVEEQRIADLVSLSRGHPLALVLLTQAPPMQRDSQTPSLRDAPTVLADLVRRMISQSTSADQRRALEICAHARTTTLELLQAFLGDAEGRAALQSLAELPFAEVHRDGVRLHALVRDVVDEDLRWRAPEAYRAMHLAMGELLLARVRQSQGGARDRAFLDLLALRRVSASARKIIDFDGLGGGWAETPRADEWPAVAALLAGRDGPEAPRLALPWWEKQRESFTVLRSALGEPVVVSAHLVLGAADLASSGDFVLDAVARQLESWGGLQPGEQVVVTRFAAGVDPAPDKRLRHYRPLLAWLTTPRLAAAFTALPDGARWEPALTQIGHARLGELTFGEKRAPLLGREFRRVSPALWFREVLERDLDDAPLPSDPGQAPLALSREELSAGLKDALRQLEREDLLAQSPLCGLRAVAQRVGTTGAASAALRALLCEAVESMAAAPADEKLGRLLHTVFLRPAATQELAAERLGLPFSTFRRHLARALERLTDVLWAMERGAR